VLAHHYPSTPNLGDMTKFKEWSIESNVDLLVGGTPCQSFSVAGLRKGLDDPRGNLMLTYLAIADKYRPRWLVWENVPGVLSSNGGEDFGTFLGGLGELGYGFAYRVLDAQYFGVAQRRRRVFVVGYLGDWRPAAAVLFERYSLSGHPAPSREKGQEIAGTIAARFGQSRNNHEECVTWPAEIAPTLTADFADKLGQNNQHIDSQKGGMFVQHKPVYEMHGQDSRVRDLGETCSTVTSKWGTGGGNVPVTMQPTIIHGTQDPCVSDIAFAQGRNNGGENVLVQAVGTDLYNGAITGDVAATMGTPGSSINASGPTVMQVVGAFKPGQSAQAHSIGYENEMAPTLEAGSGGNNKPAVHVGMAVRRLTPVECERLQGFPDSYTDIKSKDKPTPDGPRYKALGNSMAVPVMAWIGQRIEQVEAICKQNK
jgi:DNA (cytosine-5)-methyltransferase 1